MPTDYESTDEPERRSWQPTLIATCLILFVLGWGVAWLRVRDRVASQEEYVLQVEQVELTPAPPWIRCDVRAEVWRQASFDADPQSILDEGLAERIHDAFPLHPWIARVRRVTKAYPASVKVDVVYRQPVCVVEVPGGVYPVDVEGVLLPSGDFSAVDATRFPLLRGIDTQPDPVGAPWGDERVVEGCRVAESLASVWMELQLASIAPLPEDEDFYDEPYHYELLTRGGTRILWGPASPATKDGQTIVQAKIARLRQYVDDHGSLDAVGRTIHLDGLDTVNTFQSVSEPSPLD